VRFSFAESLTDPTFYIPLAKAAEAAGYHSMTIADSIAYPFESDSKYPYTPDGSREFLDGKEIVEAFVLTAALGAVTTNLRFNFFVLKLPVRHPALTAKQAGSLAALTGNRLGLGVGTSPWPEDYELMGIPFAKRGKRMDECIEIVHGLTSGDYFEYHGEFYDIPKTKMSPAPTQPIPILVGGHADAALRRAARLDGWMHGGGTDPEELDRLIARVKKFRLPVALHQRTRHRATGEKDPSPGAVRRKRDVESLSITGDPMLEPASPGGPWRPRPDCW
jgi:alkanesulfonate monooxygenase SsuD/methylene tetrahydromethanopterin reductase-like flavin-dependent oxidoreductase (luciferase family)